MARARFRTSTRVVAARDRSRRGRSGRRARPRRGGAAPSGFPAAPPSPRIRARLQAAHRRALLALRAHERALRQAARPRARARANAPPGVQAIPAVGHAREPSAFGGPTGPLRLFSLSLGGQDGWFLPFALAGLLAAALLRPRRRDPALATLIVLGGWFACEALLLSFSKGIVHPYYVSALGPAAAAMAGIGAVALARSARPLSWRVVLIPIAAGATVAVQIMLLGRDHYLHAFVPVLVGGAVAAVLVALLVRPAAGAAVAVLLALCLIAPAAYASTLWQVPTEGTFPAAGPHAAHGLGGVGAAPPTLTADRRLIAYVDAHGPGTRWRRADDRLRHGRPAHPDGLRRHRARRLQRHRPGPRRTRTRALGGGRPGPLRAPRWGLLDPRRQRRDARDPPGLPARALDRLARHPRERGRQPAAVRLSRAHRAARGGRLRRAARGLLRDFPPIARVFVTRPLAQPALQRLAEAHDVDTWEQDEPPPREDLVRRASGADGLLCMLTDRIDAELLDHCPRLRVISTYAVGVDNIDLAAAAARSIVVGHTPDVLTDATADLAFGLLLAAARFLGEGERAVREGRWGTWRADWLAGADVAGTTLGIVGYGTIGQAVARRARGFDMEVLWSSSSGGVPLGELLNRSDHVTLHCPLTPTTRHLIDAEALHRMKPTATLVNTARGEVVDSAALRQALVDGHIGAAGLDVTDPEPLPPDDPLLDAPHLVVTPHIGSATLRTRARMAELAVANLLAGLAGEPLPSPVAVRGG